MFLIMIADEVFQKDRVDKQDFFESDGGYMTIIDISNSESPKKYFQDKWIKIDEKP